MSESTPYNDDRIVDQVEAYLREHSFSAEEYTASIAETIADEAIILNVLEKHGADVTLVRQALAAYDYDVQLADITKDYSNENFSNLSYFGIESAADIHSQFRERLRMLDLVRQVIAVGCGIDIQRFDSSQSEAYKLEMQARIIDDELIDADQTQAWLNATNELLYGRSLLLDDPATFVYIAGRNIKIQAEAVARVERYNRREAMLPILDGLRAAGEIPVHDDVEEIEDQLLFTIAHYAHLSGTSEHNDYAGRMRMIRELAEDIGWPLPRFDRVVAQLIAAAIID